MTNDMLAETLAETVGATWPPAAIRHLGPWLLRDGKGGGKRVSAASLSGTFDSGDIDAAESAMRSAGEQPLFQIGADQQALDDALAERKYDIVDPVTLYAIALDEFSLPPPPMTTFPHWPPLGIAIDLWAEGGIGPERMNVMHRVQGPKCAILARIADRAAGVAFVALHGRAAMLHGLEVTPALRRKGSARHILHAAAVWAKAEGATDLALAVTTANVPARALYASIGMQVVGQYHYRQVIARKEAR